MAARDTTIEIDGREVKVSSPQKVFFPDRGETKLDLVEYYRAIGDAAMRAMRGRPVLLQRYPNGATGSSFFQKRVGEKAPEWLETTIVATPNGTTSRALVVADLAHVVWAVNLGCLGFHVWPSRAADPEHADELRLDLDPNRASASTKHEKPRVRYARSSTSSASPATRRRPATAASTYMSA